MDRGIKITLGKHWKMDAGYFAGMLAVSADLGPFSFQIGELGAGEWGIAFSVFTKTKAHCYIASNRQLSYTTDRP